LNVANDKIVKQQRFMKPDQGYIIKDKRWHEIFIIKQICNMVADFPSMTKNLIPVLELRRLLFELKDLRPDIHIRFRIISEMWQNNHHRVLKLTEKSVALNDEKSNKLIFIQDLNNVMQFEIDHSFQQYQPHFHYTVNPSLVWS
jgi:hypothetical protein